MFISPLRIMEHSFGQRLSSSSMRISTHLSSGFSSWNLDAMIAPLDFSGSLLSCSRNTQLPTNVLCASLSSSEGNMSMLRFGLSAESALRDT